jgi:hypothetical protein
VQVKCIQVQGKLAECKQIRNNYLSNKKSTFSRQLSLRPINKKKKLSRSLQYTLTYKRNINNLSKLIQRRRFPSGSRSEKTDSGFLSGFSREASTSAEAVFIGNSHFALNVDFLLALENKPFQ